MQNEIRQTWFFNKPPGVVWEWLTRAELIEQWLGENDFLPVVGHKFRFISPYGNDSICEVLEVKSCTRLSYSWQKNSAKDSLPFHSIIEWTLIPTKNGTELQLVHGGFRALEDIAPHEKGWNYCHNELEGLLKIDSEATRDKIKTIKEPESRSFTTDIEVSKSANDVFNCLREVSKWWSVDFEGESSNLNDEFIIHHPHQHYSKQKLVEVDPGRKIVWLVVDSVLYWLKDKHEWTNTKMIFEIAEKGDKTLLQYTHEGLVPEKECYSQCAQGWTMVIRDRLFSFIEDGKTI